MANKIETVATVKDVDGPNANGWYEVTFDDKSKATTKNEELAKAAFQARDTVADVVISEVDNGRFKNRYLNKFNDVVDKPPKGGRPTAMSNGRKEDPARQKRIERQWAYGRALDAFVELSDLDFEEVVKAVEAGMLDDLATALLGKISA